MRARLDWTMWLVAVGFLTAGASLIVSAPSVAVEYGVGWGSGAALAGLVLQCAAVEAARRALVAQVRWVAAQEIAALEELRERETGGESGGLR